MMRLFRRPQNRRNVSTHRPRLRGLRLEALETRDCPNAVISSFAVSQAVGHYVTVSGVVQDSDPATDTVSVGGFVDGPATVPTGNGTFSAQRLASSVGVVTAVANSPSGDSARVSATLANAAPAVSLTATWLGGNSIRITGTVSDENPAN